MSRWSDEIQLLSIVEGTNDNGYPVEEEVLSEIIFANKKSVRSSEFYQAASTGKAVQVMFEIYTVEFNENAKYVIFEEKQYGIVRTYDKGEKTEIVCTSGSSMKQSGR
ncbi:phage head closure protein [Lysinibacillus sphaericus]|uniref:phage head closure protein n=1 Tax=Lysinibacillus sphaericus TaxID=1421 RepID=UPI003D018765